MADQQSTAQTENSSVTITVDDETDAILQVEVYLSINLSFKVTPLSFFRSPFSSMFSRSALFGSVVRLHVKGLQIIKVAQLSTVEGEGPLKDVRVLDMTRIVAGPYCSMILGDLGAEVIKIEKPGDGDESRKWGPPYANNTTETCYFIGLNRNKKSITVNFKSEEGRKIIFDLSEKSDVLIENYVPGTLDKMGLGYDDMKKVSPHLIYCSVTGYGSRGPYKHKPGYDVIAASIGGLMSITGPQEGPPCKVGVAMTDLSTGLYAHGAILAALLARAKTGKGQKIDCNLLSTQVACLINIGSNYLNAGVEGEKWGSSHVSIVPYRSYETYDGEYLTLGTGSDLQFKELCSKLDVPEIAESLQFKTNRDRVKNRNQLDSIISEKILSKTLKEWCAILEGSTFPFGPVNKISQVFNDEHIREIGLVKEIDHPVAGKIRMVGPPVEFSSSKNAVYLPPPLVGQHTVDILKNVLGYSDEKIMRLEKNKIQNVATVRLKLRKPKSGKKVNWTEETVDNENMNKKKSKCCCVYKKPKGPEDSSSSEDDSDECEHCFGHVEKKKKTPNDNSSPTRRESNVPSMIVA